MEKRVLLRYSLRVGFLFWIILLSSRGICKTPENPLSAAAMNCFNTLRAGNIKKVKDCKHKVWILANTLEDSIAGAYLIGEGYRNGALNPSLGLTVSQQFLDSAFLYFNWIIDHTSQFDKYKAYSFYRLGLAFKKKE